jgi:hypothetical protein
MMQFAGMGRAAAGLVAVAATALLAAPGGASAASRGFEFHNKSSHTFTLNDIRSVPCSRTDVHCKDGDPDEQYPMEFEGYPEQYSQLKPGGSLRVELKYGASWGKNFSYAADVMFDGFMVRITTTTTTNDSECFMGSRAEKRFDCTARGLNITITDDKNT